MLILLSKLLHFATYHPLKFLIISVVVTSFVTSLVSKITKTEGAFAAIPIVFFLSIGNLIAGHWINAFFIHNVGVYGKAIIVDSGDAGFMINDWEASYYDILVTTEEGQEILTNGTDMSIPLYPLRNTILMPPIDEEFVVKYVPGDEENFVIMADDSNYGKRRLLGEARQPVERARHLYEASSENLDFVQQYREALQTFISEQAGIASDDQIQRYHEALQGLTEKDQP